MTDAEMNATIEANAQKVAAIRSKRELLTELLEDEILLMMVGTQIGELAVVHAENDDMSWLDIAQVALRDMLEWPLDDNYGVKNESGE